MNFLTPYKHSDAAPPYDSLTPEPETCAMTYAHGWVHTTKECMLARAVNTSFRSEQAGLRKIVQLETCRVSLPDVNRHRQSYPRNLGSGVHKTECLPGFHGVNPINVSAMEAAVEARRAEKTILVQIS